MKKVNNCLIILLLNVYLSSVSSKIPEIKPLEKNGCYDIIIIAGQSNAVGIGKCLPSSSSDSLCPNLSDPTADDKIYQLSQKNNSGDVDIELVSETGQLKHWSNSDIDSSFAMTFARDYVKNSLTLNRDVMLIPSAMGATSITEWCPGCKSNKPNTSQHDKPLYDNMLDRINYAISLNESCNRVVAFLWHQGETDCLRYELKKNYEERLTYVLTSLRNDLRSQGQFPIVMGKLVPSWFPRIKSYKRVVETAIANVSLKPAILPSVIVESSGLTSNYDLGLANDKGHFSSQAQIEFGHRYFTSFMMLLWRPK